MPTTQEVIKDPDFLALPDIEKKKVMQRIDTDFAGLPDVEQNKVVMQFETGGAKPPEQGKGFLSNLVADISNIVKGTSQMVTHPIETGKQIAEYQISKTELPQYLEDKPTLAGLYGAGAVVGKTSWDVVKGMAYDVTHPYEKPISALLTISPMLRATGALATKVPALAKTGQVLKIAGRTTDPFNLTWQGAKMASKPIGWMGKQLTGALTGKGVANVEQWMKGSKDFFDVLHGRIEEAKIIENVKAGFKAVKEKRGIEYGKTLKTLNMSQEIGFQGIDNTLINIGKKFRFDKGIPTLNKVEMADFDNIIKIIDDIKAQPVGSTALGLDSLKQQLDYFYTENTRISSIISDLRNTINKEIGSKIPAYTEMNKRYAQLTTLANDMEQTLIGKGNINTTFNKLQSAMKEDAQLRRALMEEMENLTGINAQAQIAGFAGQPILASGLVGRSVEFGLFAGVIAQYINPKMLTLVLMSSPRAMSEFLGSIGWTKQQIAPLLQIRTKFPADVMRNGLIIYAKQMQEKIEKSPMEEVQQLKGQSTLRPEKVIRLDAEGNEIQGNEITENYGLRLDRTPKGKGYLGELKRPSGGISTELSIGVNINGKEIQIPTLVPTLNQQEIDYLLGGKEPTPEIVNKAVQHAKQRMKIGKSPFAD